MKTNSKILGTIIGLTFVFCMSANARSNAPADPHTGCSSGPSEVSVSFQLFYDQLSPHGTWLSFSNYGYVWMPNAGPDFYPYSTAGQWVYTDAGWTWYSTYSWGWAPFHYGRWLHDNYYGWMWVPDTQWAPAWVMWRSGGDYYGWAPLEPGVRVNVVFGGSYQLPNDRWIFVRNRDINRINVSHYTVNYSDNTNIIINTTVIKNSHGIEDRMYTTGPDRSDVQRATGKPVKQLAIRQHNKPGQDLNSRGLTIYKPNVQRDEESGKKSEPSRVETLGNVKPMPERYIGGPQRNRSTDARSEQRNSDRQPDADKKSRGDKQPENIKQPDADKPSRSERKRKSDKQKANKQFDTSEQPAQNKTTPNQPDRKQGKNKKDGAN
jgi:hypothetical protein